VQVLALEPGSAAAHCNLGNLLRDRGASAEALERFRRAVELDSRLVEAQIGLTLALRDLGQADEALESSRRLSKDHSRSAAALMFESKVCLEQGDSEGAAKALRAAITLQDSNADAHYQLGNVLMRQ